MTSPWPTDAQLAGPYGTQRLPQVEDLLPALKAQLHNAPQVQLKGYPVERWRLSPFVWGMQNMADNPRRPPRPERTESHSKSPSRR